MIEIFTYRIWTGTIESLGIYPNEEAGLANIVWINKVITSSYYWGVRVFEAT